jgi:redox-sensitive bicupin YhaK (pirin superfamily)
MSLALAKSPLYPARVITHRTRGRKHGPVTRLLSPSDLGEVLKPFVFLDLFDVEGAPNFGGLHPHSGIATLTYIQEGAVNYIDPDDNRGTVSAGGIEWMQAGGGMWHGGGFRGPGRTRGFQLWIALPPALELGPTTSVYQSADDLQSAGPATILLGSYRGVSSRIAAPAPINYLGVRLKAGERWIYQPPAGHEVLWAAVSHGVVRAPEEVRAGDVVAFERSEQAVEFEALSDTAFVLGSAVPHGHDLVLGYYSVHTSPGSLRKGEANISNIQQQLIQTGRL